MLQFLRKRRGWYEPTWLTPSEDPDKQFSVTDLVSAAFQVARAMEFLVSRKVRLKWEEEVFTQPPLSPLFLDQTEAEAGSGTVTTCSEKLTHEILYFSTKTTQLYPQGFLVAVYFSGNYPDLLTSFFVYRKSLPNLVSNNML